MMNAGVDLRPPHRPASLAPAHRQIAFSVPPSAMHLSVDRSPVAIVRHRGAPGGGLATVNTIANRHAVLVLNIGSTGRYRGRVGDMVVDHPLRRGHVHFIPAGVSVSVDYPASHAALVMLVSDKLIKANLAQLASPELAIMLNRPCERLAQLMLMIEHEARAPGFATDLMIDGLVQALATTLARQGAEARVAEPERIHLPPAKLNRVIAFVEARLHEEVSLKDMADVAGLSPFHFSRMFKLATGETPYHFLGSRRLERARRLLAEGNMPLAELALACGFASQSHFTAAFTKAMGTSPGKFRKTGRS